MHGQKNIKVNSSPKLYQFVRTSCFGLNFGESFHPVFMTDEKTDTCTGLSCAVSLAFWLLYPPVKALRMRTENRK